MKKARKEGHEVVNSNNLPEVDFSLKLDYWSRKFTECARKLWSKPKVRSKYATAYILCIVFWKQILANFLLKVFNVYVQLNGSKLSNKMIDSFQETNTGESKRFYFQAAYIACSVLFLDAFSTLLGVHTNFWWARTGLQMQGALTTCLFRRIILPKSEKPDDGIICVDETKEVSIYNLQYVDIPTIVKAFKVINELLTLPFLVILGFRVIHQQVGNHIKYAVIFVIVTSIIVVSIESINALLKLYLLNARDIRIDRCHDALVDIRTLRLVGWEHYAEKAVSESRIKEMKIRSIRMYLHGFSMFISVIFEPVALYCIVASYAIAKMQHNQNLTVELAKFLFVPYLVSKFVQPVSQLTHQSHSLLEGLVSLERYQHYVFGSSSKEGNDKLLLSRSSVAQKKKENDDRLDGGKSKSFNSLIREIEPVPITVHDAIFSWTFTNDSKTSCDLLSKNTATNNLENSRSFTIIPELVVSRGECVVLLGANGSGKSSVLLALLGEMNKLTGDVFVLKSRRVEAGEEFRYNITSPDSDSSHCSVGYDPQVPWLQDGTVKSAILFGRPYDRVRYTRVTEVCDLIPDFESWPEGDNRIITECGSNLSGGQRGRISLARAIYDYPVSVREIHTLDYRHIGPYGFQGCTTFFLDDMLSTADPGVGYTIFENLFKEKGLLTNAATVMAINDTNFFFFLKSFKEKELKSGVKFKLMLVENGKVTPVPLSKVEDSLPLNNIDERFNLLSDDEDQENNLKLVSEVPKTNVDKFLLDINNEDIPKKQRLEKTSRGRIGLNCYWWFTKRFGIKTMFFLIIFFIIAQGLKTNSSLWLVRWGKLITDINTIDIQKNVSSSLNKKTTNNILQSDLPSPKENENFSNFDSIDENLSDYKSNAQKQGFEINRRCFVVYSFIVLSIITIVFISIILETKGALKAAIKCHTEMLNSVLSAPTSFFDRVPLGALLNRFSSDVQYLDASPIYQTSSLLNTLLSIFFSSCLIIHFNKISILILPFMLIGAYICIFQLYYPSNREFQRSKLVNTGALVGCMSSASTGAILIRAMGASDACIKTNMILTTNVQRPIYFQASLDAWAELRLRFLALPFSLSTYIIPVVCKVFNLSPSTTGTLSALLTAQIKGNQNPYKNHSVFVSHSMTAPFRTAVTSLAEIEKFMCSIQRIRAYCNLSSTNIDAKALYQISQELPKKRIEIKLTNVNVIYGVDRLKDELCFKDSELCNENYIQRHALENFNVTAKVGEWTAIVGRTGAGKSTLLLTLRGLIEPVEGTITVDNIPLSCMSKRCKSDIIGVLPQDPFILKEWSVRKFIDPENEFTDFQIIELVKKVGLHDFILQLPQGYDTIISKESYTKDRKKNIEDIYFNDNFEDFTEFIIENVKQSLSLSQLRRLSLVRLSLNVKKYRYILIDEPPEGQIESNDVLQESSEDNSQDLLRQLFPDSTLFIVAHLATAIRSCDKIWVISKGKLAGVESGKEIKTQAELTDLLKKYS